MYIIGIGMELLIGDGLINVRMNYSRAEDTRSTHRHKMGQWRRGSLRYLQKHENCQGKHASCYPSVLLFFSII